MNRHTPRQRNPLVYTVNGIADHGVKWKRHGDRATATIHGAIGSVKLELNPVNVLDGSGPRKPGGVAWGTAPAYELLINDSPMARLKASTLDAALADVNEVLADELGGMYATMLAAHPLNRKNPAKRRNPASKKKRNPNERWFSGAGPRAASYTITQRFLTGPLAGKVITGTDDLPRMVGAVHETANGGTYRIESCEKVGATKQNPRPRRNPEVTYTLGTTEYRLTGEGRDPVIHVRRRGGDFYVLPASSLGPREYARVFREWAKVTKRRNPAAGWTFAIAPSPGQRVRAKRIVSLWNGTMVGNVATFETATEARLAASQMDDDGIRWTRPNPRHRNPATAGDDVTKPYPWAKKEAEYQSWQMGPQQLREARDEAMRSRDQADATAKPSQSAYARAEMALKAAEKAHHAAKLVAERDYAIYGWHADDVSTIAQERSRRLADAKGASAREIAALSNPRRRAPARRSR